MDDRREEEMLIAEGRPVALWPPHTSDRQETLQQQLAAEEAAEYDTGAACSSSSFSLPRPLSCRRSDRGGGGGSED